MKWVVRSGEREHQVEVEHTAEGLAVEVDGRRRVVDFICLDGHLASMRFAENSRSFEVAFQRGAAGAWRMVIGEREFPLEVLTPVEATELGAAAAAQGPSRVEAPIPGKVVAVQVAPGDVVAAGTILVVLEAMKMENELAADRDGTVTAVHVSPGAAVEAGTLLVELE